MFGLHCQSRSAVASARRQAATNSSAIIRRKLTEACLESNSYCTHFKVYHSRLILAPTLAPGIPTLAPAPAISGLLQIGRCNGTGQIVGSALAVEECPSLCAHASGCHFFSHSSTEGKLSYACDHVNSYQTGFMAYELVAITAATNAPTPLTYTEVYSTGEAKEAHCHFPLWRTSRSLPSSVSEDRAACISSSRAPVEVASSPRRATGTSGWRPIRSTSWAPGGSR
jgi:hypothetical protein